MAPTADLLKGLSHIVVKVGSEHFAATVTFYTEVLQFQQEDADLSADPSVQSTTSLPDGPAAAAVANDDGGDPPTSPTGRRGRWLRHPKSGTAGVIGPDRPRPTTKHPQRHYHVLPARQASGSSWTAVRTPPPSWRL